MGSADRQPDYLDKPRGIAAAGLVAAGGAAVLGALLDWVTIEPPDILPADQAAKAQPFSGIELTGGWFGVADGWWVIGAGVLLMGLSVMLTLRRRSIYAWTAFLASLVIGSIGVADYRGIGATDSALNRRMDIVGSVKPALGITLVAAAAGVGVIASLIGVAATPKSSA